MAIFIFQMVTFLLSLSFCLLSETKISVQDFVCHLLLFSINKENFKIFNNISFWGKNLFFRNFRFSQNLLVWFCWRHWHYDSYCYCQHIVLIEKMLQISLLPTDWSLNYFEEYSQASVRPLSSTFSNDISSEAMRPILTNFTYSIYKPRGTIDCVLSQSDKNFGCYGNF